MPQNDERTAWELVPFEAVGPLRFGMSRSEVAAILDEEPRPEVIPPGMRPLPTTQETFDATGVGVVYDPEGRLLAVESLDRPVTYRGVALVNGPAEDACAELKRIGIGSAPNDEGNGIDVPELGLMFYVPGSDAVPPGTVEAVMATRRDYHEVVAG